MLCSFIQNQTTRLELRANLVGEEVERVKVCCGHLTYDTDAETMVEEVKGLIEKMIGKYVRVRGSVWVKEGWENLFWIEDGKREARDSIFVSRNR
jgi:hypothetical protein